MPELRLGGAAAAAIASVLLLAAGAPAAAAPIFRDPAGDTVGGPSPDLTAIAVSHSRTRIAFRITFASAPPLQVSATEGWVDMLLIGVDVPPFRRAVTRDNLHQATGMDYGVGIHGGQRDGSVVKAPGWRRVGSFHATVQGRTLSFSISRAALGNPRELQFVVIVGREVESATAPAGADASPLRGMHRYRFSPAV